LSTPELSQISGLSRLDSRGAYTALLGDLDNPLARRRVAAATDLGAMRARNRTEIEVAVRKK